MSVYHFEEISAIKASQESRVSAASTSYREQPSKVTTNQVNVLWIQYL